MFYVETDKNVSYLTDQVTFENKGLMIKFNFMTGCGHRATMTISTNQITRLVQYTPPVESFAKQVMDWFSNDMLWALMDWDEKHGPTEDQWNALVTLVPELKLDC